MSLQTVVLIGSLDTKGPDVLFLKELVERKGAGTLVIDIGVLGDPGFSPDISAAEVADAGGTSLSALRQKGDRGHALQVMQTGIAAVVRSLFVNGSIHGVMGIGGGSGTSVATAAMRGLPMGVPKIMITTLASGSTEQYLGEKDILMFPSIVDITGVNRISAGVYSRAVGALIGMMKAEAPEVALKPLVAASMFGNTTPVVERCKSLVQARGVHEVIIFHATGTGGRCMESLIRDGRIEGVMDITTTELADELAGGVMSAGPGRLTAAGERGLPQIIVPGCVDMVNFWGETTIPDTYRDRRFYRWNPDVTLMRTTPEENRLIGTMIAEKANASKGPVVILLPLRGVSLLDCPGKEFWWEDADTALFESIKCGVHSGVDIIEKNCNINDEQFADAIVETFAGMLYA